MTKLAARYDAQEDIPDGYADLYTERNGGWEVTGITGIRTQADVDRIDRALKSEREDHAATKDKLKAWTPLGESAEAVQEILDRVPELEVAAKGKLDDAQIETLVTQRVEAKINSAVAPVQRKLDKATTDLETMTTERDGLLAADTTRRLHDAVRPALRKLGVMAEHDEDAFLYADRFFETDDEGRFVTKDGVGVTPGVEPEVWLTEFVEKRPGWLGASNGTGSTGSRRTGGRKGANPFTHEGWNETEQVKLHRENPEKAAQMAKAAGTEVGGPRPAPKT